MLRKLSTSSVLLWGMVIIAGAYFVYLRAPDWLEKESDPRSQEFLGKIAAEINRSIPVMIDQETELMPAVGAARDAYLQLSSGECIQPRNSITTNSRRGRKND